MNPEDDVQKVDVEPEESKSSSTSCLGSTIAMGGILFSIVYILNPTGGFIEAMPDNVPIFGNIDEAAVMALFFACLRYLGIDVLPFKKKQD